jgi:hypothetical protein
VKKKEIVLNHVYEAKVSDLLVPVRILCSHPAGGWIGRNERTGREVRIRSAARLRREIGWGRIALIRRRREAGLSYEQACAWVDRNERQAADLAHDVLARTRAEGELA